MGETRQVVDRGHLLYLMKEKKMNLEDLGRVLGCNKATAGKRMNGAPFSEDEILRLKEFFGKEVIVDGI